MAKSQGVLSTRHSALGIQHSAFSTRHSALGIQHSALHILLYCKANPSRYNLPEEV